MPVGRGSEFADDIARRLADTYREAERQIATRIAERLSAGIELDSWEIDKLREIGSLRREVSALMGGLLDDQQGLADAISTAYDQGGLEAEQEILSSSRRTAGAGGQLSAADQLAVLQSVSSVGQALPGNQAVQRLTGRLAGQLGPLGPRVIRSATDIYQKAITQASAAPGVLLGTQTRRQATQQALNTLWSNGVTGFVDKAGRKWQATTYAEMAMRTTVNQALIEGHLDRLASVGLDLVIVSDTPLNCDRCAPWEAKVLSQTTPGYRTITVPSELDDSPTQVVVAGSVAEAMSAGLLHPHCRHSLSAYIPGVTTPYTAVDDPEGYAASQRQRELERRVRRDRLQEAGAVDDAARAKYGARAQATERELAEHVKANKARGLRRKREREQIDLGHTRPNQTPVKQPTAAAPAAPKPTRDVLTAEERAAAAARPDTLGRNQTLHDRVQARVPLAEYGGEIGELMGNQASDLAFEHRLTKSMRTRLATAPTGVERATAMLDDVEARWRRGGPDRDADIRAIIDEHYARSGLTRIGHGGEIHNFDQALMKPVGPGVTIDEPRAYILRPGAQYHDPIKGRPTTLFKAEIIPADDALKTLPIGEATPAGAVDLLGDLRAQRNRLAAKTSLTDGAMAERYAAQVAELDTRIAKLDGGGLEAHLASGIRSRRPLGGGMESDTFLVTTNDGAVLVRKNVRAIADQSRDEAIGTSATAEVLAARVAETVGLKAPRTIRGLDEGADGLWMDRLPGDTGAMYGWPKVDYDAAQAFVEKLADTDSGRRMGLLDVLIGNLDRNPGNYLLDAAHENIAGVIDHGAAWQKGGAGRGRAKGAPPRYMEGKPFSKAFIGPSESGKSFVWIGDHGFSFEDLKEMHDKFQELQEEFEAAGQLQWFDITNARFDEILKNAKRKGL